jgi:two-component system sensor kinase FixL
MKRVGSVSEYSSFQAWWADNGQPLAPEEWASAQAVVTGEPVVGQVLEIQRFDGKRAFVINSASPVRDASGNIVGSAVSVQDITSLRQAQQALRESEQRWATTLASIGDAVVTTDRQGCVTYFNPVAEKLSGWGRQEAAGLPMEQVFPLVNEETLRPAENPVEKVLHSGRVAGLANHTALIARSGRRIPIEDSAAPIQGSAGQILGVVMVFHDVTEKRKKEAALREADALMRDYAQKLERSNRELQDFASIASHDLQEPLRKIRAFSDLLQARLEGRLDEQELDMLKRMLSATNRMHELIDSLLTYSRVTTKAQPFKTVDLGEVAEEVVAGFEVQIERSGGRVELGDLPKVQADPVQMRQLLQNLVGNALKFHRDGVPPLVQISGGVAPASRESGTHPMVRLEVKDNGIGFDLRYLERIFRPFERLHGRGEFEGAGMGLAICKKIVERHQGSIDARSTVGEGSTFIVTLPVKPGQ